MAGKNANNKPRLIQILHYVRGIDDKLTLETINIVAIS